MNALEIINAALCAAIAVRLMLFRRAAGSHRPAAAWLAYVLTLATASVPIRVIFGAHPAADVTTVAINAVLCLAVFAVRGNVVDLFRCSADQENPITRILRKVNDTAR